MSVAQYAWDNPNWWEQTLDQAQVDHLWELRADYLAAQALQSTPYRYCRSYKVDHDTWLPDHAYLTDADVWIP